MACLKCEVSHFLYFWDMSKWIQIVFGCGFLILCTQIDIDLHLGDINIPITGQSFAVVLVGYLLGAHYGAITILLYLFLGGVGLPIFANGGSGFQSLLGNSGGYLYGFVPAAYLCGYLHDKGLQTFAQILCVMTLGTIVILTIGVSHLTYMIGIEKALQYGLYPFVPGAGLKIVLAAIVAFIVKNRFRK